MVDREIMRVGEGVVIVVAEVLSVRETEKS